ncbi:MAG: HemK family protein methyltransferase [Candidatus Dormibacteraeota bacterium]|nr:HemK family protein methyltransferase [Candidatus Dormibacteraeota bacterium]
MSAQHLTVGELLTEGAHAISRSRSIDHWQPSLSRYDAEELMSEALGRVIAGPVRRELPSAAVRQRYARMIARRINGEPVAQIVGHFEFRGLRLRVRRGVFVPRVSSELLAGEAIRLVRRRRGERTVVDVATGTGPVALAVANEVPSASVWGLDISSDAVSLGRDNARRLGIRNVRFATSDMLDALPSRLRGVVDVFTIHPPYVARGELRILPREIRDFEPLHSLTDGSDDGLGLVRRLAADAVEWLRPGGTLLVEIGTYLSRRAQATMRRAGLVDVSWTKDSLGVTRVVSGRRPQ